MNKTFERGALMSAACSSLLVGGLASGTVLAEHSYSANVGVTSNYIFRGVSESGDDAAVFGGLDYEHNSGFYLGTWLSSLGGDEELGHEIDAYGGFTFDVEDFGLDIGYTYFGFPQADSDLDANFGEIHAEAGYGPVYAGVFYVIHADDSAFEDTVSYELGGDVPIAGNLSAGAQVGYVDFDDSAEEDYLWWSLSLNKATDMGDFSFAYVQNDLSALNDDDPRFYVTYEIGF